MATDDIVYDVSRNTPGSGWLLTDAATSTVREVYPTKEEAVAAAARRARGAARNALVKVHNEDGTMTNARMLTGPIDTDGAQVARTDAERSSS